MNKPFVFLFFLTLLIGVSSCEEKVKKYDITDFGAKGDYKTLNTKAMQSAIDACYENGGGIVNVPFGGFITGTLILKDRVVLNLENGGEIIGSKRLLDYVNIDPFTDAVGQKRGNCLIGAVDASDIGITGSGKIIGRGEYFRVDSLKKAAEIRNLPYDYKAFNERPFLLRFVRSNDIVLKGVNLSRPAAWTVHFFQCKGVDIEKISIKSHSNKNNDGIDVDSSSDFFIRDCDIDSSDDALCFKTTSPVATSNIRVSRCRLSSEWGAIKFGTESMGDFTNIRIDSCFIKNTRGGGIKMLSVDGANISNIKINQIVMEEVDMPIFMRLGERLRTYRDAEQQKVGSIDNISISNIRATCRKQEESRVSPPSGIFITGTPNHKIGSIHLQNIFIQLPGGGTAEQAEFVPEEQETKYPEFSFFGVLPAFGMYARHVENIAINDFKVQLRNSDLRENILMKDVDNKTILNTTVINSKK
ncbi:MAG: right-handed parallel beta-helix repeat-containing protein [Cyclobacteriaceae bacterium]